MKVKALAIDQMKEKAMHQVHQGRVIVMKGEARVAMEKDMWGVGAAKGSEVKA